VAVRLWATPQSRGQPCAASLSERPWRHHPPLEGAAWVPCLAGLRGIIHKPPSLVWRVAPQTVEVCYISTRRQGKGIEKALIDGHSKP
jgi:hypothetical protein